LDMELMESSFDLMTNPLFKIEKEKTGWCQLLLYWTMQSLDKK
jgi:hypothetical protein